MTSNKDSLKAVSPVSLFHIHTYITGQSVCKANCQYLVCRLSLQEIAAVKRAEEEAMAAAL